MGRSTREGWREASGKVGADLLGFGPLSLTKCRTARLSVSPSKWSRKFVHERLKLKNIQLL